MRNIDGLLLRYAFTDLGAGVLFTAHFHAPRSHVIRDTSWNRAAFRFKTNRFKFFSVAI